MKIAFVIDRELPGTGRTALVGYASALQRLGHEVVVLCPRVTGPTPFTVVTPPASAARSRLKFLSWVIRRLRLIDADINHLFFSRGMSLVARAIGLSGTVVDVRSASLGSGLKNKLSRVATRIELGLVRSNISTIDPGIEPLLFGPLPLRSIGQTPIGSGSNVDRSLGPAAWAVDVATSGYTDVVLVGSLHPIRNPGRVLEGFLRADPVANRLRLWLVGEGRMRARLEAEVAELGLQEHVRFTGLVDHDQIIASLPYFDVGLAYVPVTDYFDHQPPLKTLECLAAGLPLIATETALHKRLLNEAERHMLIADSADDLAAAMITMAKRTANSTESSEWADDNAPPEWADDKAYAEHVRSWDDIARSDLQNLYHLVGAGRG